MFQAAGWLCTLAIAAAIPGGAAVVVEDSLADGAGGETAGSSASVAGGTAGDSVAAGFRFEWREMGGRLPYAMSPEKSIDKLWIGDACYIYVVGGSRCRQEPGCPRIPNDRMIRGVLGADGNIEWEEIGPLAEPHNGPILIDGRSLLRFQWGMVTRAIIDDDGGLSPFEPFCDFVEETHAGDAVVHNGDLYAFGGGCGPGGSHLRAVSDVYCYRDAQTPGGAWEPVSIMPHEFGIMEFAMAQHDDRVYVLGGQVRHNEHGTMLKRFMSNQVFAAQFQADGGLGPWTACPRLPETEMYDPASGWIRDNHGKKGYFEALVYGGYLYVFPAASFDAACGHAELDGDGRRNYISSCSRTFRAPILSSGLLGGWEIVGPGSPRYSRDETKAFDLLRYEEGNFPHNVYGALLDERHGRVYLVGGMNYNLLTAKTWIMNLTPGTAFVPGSRPAGPGEVSPGRPTGE